MTSDFGLVGNGEVLARVRADGVLMEAFYPSVGFFRHLIQSQFGVRLHERGECLWLAGPEFRTEQRYLEDTNVLLTACTRPEISAQILDFVHPELACHVRLLEVQNQGPVPLRLDLFHVEASSVADHKGQFGYNVAYYNRLGSHVVRYRGHPWDNAVESQVVWLVSGVPQPDTFQCGVSYQEEGETIDAFRDVCDGRLRENRYACGDPNGTTSGLLWHRTLEPGASLSLTVLLVAGTSLFEAEDVLAEVRKRAGDQLLGETVGYWRLWLERGKRTLPALQNSRLEDLYLRSLLLLKLLQDRRYGAFLAAPTLDPDYRYCWPRDAVFEAWALDRCGYHEEARRFYRWCARTQTYEGLWYQNHYVDGRRHWAGVQVDQVATVIWGACQHFELNGDRAFLSEIWPTIRRAAEYLISRTDAATHLIFSEQDLWEETGGLLTYTNAAAVAGLQSAAIMAREMGREREALRWRSASEALKGEIERQLVQDGHFVGEREPFRRFSMRKDYDLDISTLGLAVPFCVVPGDSPEMVRTVELLQRSVDYPISGVGRYASDLFVGGNPWSLSAIWLALYFAETGQAAEVHRQLNWCLKHASLHDFLPEQSHKQTGAPAGASPLGWSHAWVIVLLQRLGRLVRAVPEVWTGVEPAGRPADP